MLLPNSFWMTLLIPLVNKKKLNGEITIIRRSCCCVNLHSCLGSHHLNDYSKPSCRERTKQHMPVVWRPRQAFKIEKHQKCMSPTEVKDDGNKKKKGQRQSYTEKKIGNTNNSSNGNGNGNCNINNTKNNTDKNGMERKEQNKKLITATCS